MLTESAETRRDELVGRLFTSALGAMDLLCVYLGDRLGMYRALADTGPLTSAGLARGTGVDERYAREWLEQQALAGILEAVDPDASDTERRYAVPAGHEEVLLDAGSLNHMAPMAQLVVACALPIHAVLEAFRTGDGVPYADYGADLHEGQARFTQPLFDGLLATDWFPAVPSIHDRLNGDPPARVADVACGARPVEHRDRPRLPQDQSRRARPRSGLDRARPRAPSRQRRRRPRGLSLPRRRGPRTVRAL